MHRCLQGLLTLSILMSLEAAHSDRVSLTSTKWCTKTLFGNTPYEYRLDFKTNHQLIYTYFYLKPDFSRGDLAQEGDGSWNLLGSSLSMLIADEEQKVLLRIDSTSPAGKPQMHFNPGKPSAMTFNPCD